MQCNSNYNYIAIVTHIKYIQNPISVRNREAEATPYLCNVVTICIELTTYIRTYVLSMVRSGP